MNKFNIRFAEINDIPEILSLIRELAVYEKLADQLTVTENALKEYLFGNNKFVELILAESDGKIVAQAIFFKNFSTFLGKPGIYLEDLFVKPDYRGKGIGKALLEKIISIAKERGYGRVEWSVLEWNESAINFYKKNKANLLDDWRIFRLTDDNF